MTTVSLKTIKDQNCSLSCETIETLAKAAEVKGLPYILAIIESSNHVSYFDASMINNWFAKKNITNPNDRATDFKIRYLWNAKTRDVFVPLATLHSDQIEQKDPLFSKMQLFTDACNNENGKIRIKSICDILLQVDEQEDASYWLQALYKEMLQEIMACDLFDESDRTEFHKKICMIYSKFPDPLLLPVVAATTEVSPLTQVTLEGILAKRPNDELILVLQTKLATKKEAKRLLTKILELYPNSSWAHGRYGELLEVEGNRAEAFDHFTKALDCDKTNSFAHQKLGLFHFIDKNSAKAIEHLIEACKYANPGKKSRIERYQEALKELRDSLCSRVQGFTVQWLENHNPNDAHTAACIAWLYQNENDTSRAIEYFEKATVLDPTHLFAHSRLAALYLVASNPAKALEHLNKEIQLQPSCAAHMRLGEQYRLAGERVQAEHHFSKAIQFNPEHGGAHARLGELSRLAGNRQEAHTYLAKALQLNPDDDFAHEQLGRVYLDAKMYKQAQSHLQIAIQKNPRSSSAISLMGELYRLFKKDDVAIDYFTKAIKLDPANAFAHARLASLFEHHGEATKHHLKLALELEPNNDFAHAAFAKLCYRERFASSELTEKTVFHATRAIEINQNNADGHLTLGLLHHCGGEGVAKDNVKAVECLTSAAQADPKSRLAIECLASIFTEGGHGIATDKEKAIKYWNLVLQLAPNSYDAKHRLQQLTASAL